MDIITIFKELLEQICPREKEHKTNENKFPLVLSSKTYGKLYTGYSFDNVLECNLFFAYRLRLIDDLDGFLVNAEKDDYFYLEGGDRGWRASIEEILSMWDSQDKLIRKEMKRKSKV